MISLSEKRAFHPSVTTRSTNPSKQSAYSSSNASCNEIPACVAKSRPVQSGCFLTYSRAERCSGVMCFLSLGRLGRYLTLFRIDFGTFTSVCPWLRVPLPLVCPFGRMLFNRPEIVDGTLIITLLPLLLTCGLPCSAISSISNNICTPFDLVAGVALASTLTEFMRLLRHCASHPRRMYTYIIR